MAGEPLIRRDFYDVLGLGIIAVDDVLAVDAYPPPETKVRVRSRVRQCGGLTGTALVAAARLGSRCAYAGPLGRDDELSLFVWKTLDAERIDLSRISIVEGGRPFHSTIVVDESAHTRTIFFEPGGVLGEKSKWPGPELIRSTRVLFVDHHEPGRMIRAAQVAREAGIPVVADFERAESPRFRELLGLVDHVIVGRAFASDFTGESDPAAAAHALCVGGPRTAVVTCGAEGAWSLSDPSESPRHQPAFPVKVVDTTGCGDVFHGAYASALARGADLPERIRFASAAAALKAAHPGGQAGIPTRSAVEAFLKQN